MNWLLVNKNTKLLHDGTVFNDASKEHCSIGQDQMWLQIPSEVASGNCKVHEAEDGTLSLADGSADKSSPAWDKMRAERNARLAACDWAVLTDADLTTAQKNAWKAYRTALRDLPENTIDPEQVQYPERPF